MINVAGHRLGTREIEEAVQANPLVAECRGGRRRPAEGGRSRLPSSCSRTRRRRPTQPRRRLRRRWTKRSVPSPVRGSASGHAAAEDASGKLLRRSIQALAEGRDPGDLTTIEDPAALAQIKAALGVKSRTKAHAVGHVGRGEEAPAAMALRKLSPCQTPNPDLPEMVSTSASHVGTRQRV